MEYLYHVGGGSSDSCIPYNFSLNPIDVNNETWSWEGWYTLFIILCLFLALYSETIPHEFAMIGAVMMLAAGQVITITDMVSGFGNPGILAIASLLVVAEGLASTGAVDYYITIILGRPDTIGRALLKLMVPTAFVASWISSTALLALLIPVVTRWSKQVKIPPSQIFMPLCYGIHLGATCTLIGTTTNLVISGLYTQYYCHSMGIFQLSTVGVPVCIAGLGFLLVLSPLVLPDHNEYVKRTSTSSSQTTTSVYHRKPAVIRCAMFCCCCCFDQNQVVDDVLVHGKQETIPNTFEDVFQAQINNDNKSFDYLLKNLDELLKFISIRRGNLLYYSSVVGPGFQLLMSDVLTVAGDHEHFIKFCIKTGCVPVSLNSELLDSTPYSTVEVIIRNDSILIGKSILTDLKDFQSIYKASILSIRHHHDFNYLSETRLKVGNVLVLLTSDEFDWNDLETKRDLKPLQVVQQKLEEEECKYLFSMKISSKLRLSLVRPLHGYTVEDAGLLDIYGTRLIAITRSENKILSIQPDFVLQIDDIIWFSGDCESIMNLRRIPGLEEVDAPQIKRLGVHAQNRRLYEVAVSVNSDLLNKTVQESRFRTRFQAVILAVQRPRRRQCLEEEDLMKVGNISLEPGDLLLIDADVNFANQFRNDRKNFLLISEIESSTPPRMERFYLALFITIGMIVVTATTGVEVLLPALFAIGLMLWFGILNRERVHKVIDWKIIMTVASAFGLASALTNTKIASILGTAITNLAMSTGTGQIGVITVVLLFTEILCALITAKAGAVLMFPVAATAAANMQINPLTMTFALMLGASDFTTPQGHPTNLMILGPGAYRFRDYQKLGIPFEIILNVVQVTCLVWVDYWQYTLSGCILLFFLCVLIEHLCISKLPLRRILDCCLCRLISAKRISPIMNQQPQQTDFHNIINPVEIEKV